MRRLSLDTKLEQTLGPGVIMFGPDHYTARASELEVAASRVSDSAIRASYLELARNFREMANLASLAPNAKDAEACRLAELIVEKANSTL